MSAGRLLRTKTWMPASCAGTIISSVTRLGACAEAMVPHAAKAAIVNTANFMRFLLCCLVHRRAGFVEEALHRLEQLHPGAFHVVDVGALAEHDQPLAGRVRQQ